MNSVQPFSDLAPTAATHFRLLLYGALIRVLEQVFQSLGSSRVACEQFPFLAGYCAELNARGMKELDDNPAARWCDGVATWENGVAGHLPLRALCATNALDYPAMTLLLSIGLIEEDARFGSVFEAFQATPGQRRPTVGLVNAWWQSPSEREDPRATVRRLINGGLIQVVNPDAPRVEWALQVPGVLWDAMRGAAHEALAPWAVYRAPDRLVAPDQLIVPDALRAALAKLPGLLSAGRVQTLIVRGPQHNGRRTLIGAVCRELGCGFLEVSGLARSDDQRWRLVGPLATMLHAMPVIVLDLAPGESVELPAMPGLAHPRAMVLGKHGGLKGAGTESALTITLDIPAIEQRRLHWQAGAQTGPQDLDQISDQMRMSGGNIRRAAALAQAYAAVAEHPTVTAEDAQQASRALHRQTLETLAAHVPVSGDWTQLIVSAATLDELQCLECRCREREHLQSSVSAVLAGQLNPGVRALLSGPSGTGKTLAARLLAAVLQKDLYRLDLSAVVNKYIGETEKNLSQVFARAEELDVLLLLDEGDALLTQRTDVNTANDRYANLETNYLLQRIESFSGILVVTTNARDRIDGAFHRRMDMVIDFRPPEAAERRMIWQLHLPAAHAISAAFMEDVAHRCVLSGGQIRNIVLHAAVLALKEGEIMTAFHIEAALQREYRKLGAVCPLRRGSTIALARG
jgi:ATPase family associated with various cellular activities (AAA)